MDLKIKTDRVCIVINAQKENSNPVQELEHYQGILLSGYKSFVSTIIHDSDRLSNGELKTPHLHAYIELDRKSTLKAVLSDICSKLDIISEQVSIEATNNDYLIVQYLTHKNDKDKTQYSLDLVKTNNVDLMLSKWNKAYQTEEELRVEILDKCPNIDLIDLVKTYGYNHINAMRGMIKDIKAESKSPIRDYERKINELENKSKDLEDLVDRIFKTLDNGLKKESKRIINLEDLKSAYENIVNFYDNR